MAFTIPTGPDDTSADKAKAIAEQIRIANSDVEIPHGDWVGWGYETDTPGYFFISPVRLPDFMRPTITFSEGPGGIRWSAKIHMHDNHIIGEPRTEHIPFN